MVRHEDFVWGGGEAGGWGLIEEEKRREHGTRDKEKKTILLIWIHD